MTESDGITFSVKDKILWYVRVEGNSKPAKVVIPEGIEEGKDNKKCNPKWIA